MHITKHKTELSIQICISCICRVMQIVFSLALCMRPRLTYAALTPFFFFSYVNRPNTATVGIYAL